MNRLLNNKFAKVALITFGGTTLLLAFSRYLIHFLPYYNGFQAAVKINETIFLYFFLFLLLSNLYSVIYFPVAKWKRKRVHPTVIIGPSILMSIITLGLLTPFMPTVLPSGSNLRTFDSEIWIGDQSTVPQGEITDRQKMLGDLVENILPGKSRNGIIRLLGLPSENGTIDRILGLTRDQANQSTLYFFLGPSRGDSLKIHIEFLVIHFDTTNRYKKYSIEVDD